MKRILIVGPRARFAADLIDKLRWGDYDPHWLPGLDVMDDEALGCHLLILDLFGMGDAMPGFIERVRKARDLLILGAAHIDEPDLRVAALRAGADGVFAPCIPVDELLARVSAHLARPVLRRPGGVVSVGSITIEHEARRCLVDGKEIRLTRVEFDFLAALSLRIGVAISREWLAKHVLHDRMKSAERNLDVHVSHLRRKLGHAGAQLETVRGLGYLLCNPAEDESAKDEVDDVPREREASTPAR